MLLTVQTVRDGTGCGHLHTVHGQAQKALLISIYLHSRIWVYGKRNVYLLSRIAEL